MLVRMLSIKPERHANAHLAERKGWPPRTRGQGRHFVLQIPDRRDFSPESFRKIRNIQADRNTDANFAGIHFTQIQICESGVKPDMRIFIHAPGDPHESAQYPLLYCHG